MLYSPELTQKRGFAAEIGNGGITGKVSDDTCLVGEGVPPVVGMVQPVFVVLPVAFPAGFRTNVGVGSDVALRSHIKTDLDQRLRGRLPPMLHVSA